MIKALIREFPVTDILDDMTEEKIRRYAYTKDEVDALIAEAVAEARRIDEASMAKHNREATVISMILGFTALALFVDGLLRLLGIIPPFMEIDINILDKIETDIIDKIKQVPIQKKKSINSSQRQLKKQDVLTRHQWQNITVKPQLLVWCLDSQHSHCLLMDYYVYLESFHHSWI